MPTNSSRELPLVTRADAIRSMMSLMDRCALGIALVVDDQRRLVATITDGDVRRAILLGLELTQRVGELLSPPYDRGRNTLPVTAVAGASREELLGLMTELHIRQVPLVDKENRVVDIAVDSDYIADTALHLDGFIMAGGFGKRLMPLTETCPKPMLIVNGKPILEHLVTKLRASGIRHVSISTHYLAETIVEHFQDGKNFGVEIEYVDEGQPMGTAGSLARASEKDTPLLVVNGDILTSIDFRSMLEFHCEHSADMTIAVRQYEVQIPYGVISTDGINAVSIIEKPRSRHFVSAGIYLIQPCVCAMIPRSCAYDMPDLITSLIQANKRVICFPVREYWQDIGQREEYERASIAGTAKDMV